MRAAWRTTASFTAQPVLSVGGMTWPKAAGVKKETQQSAAIAVFIVVFRVLSSPAKSTSLACCQANSVLFVVYLRGQYNFVRVYGNDIVCFPRKSNFGSHAHVVERLILDRVK